jgi:hypothetical protein
MKTTNNMKTKKHTLLPLAAIAGLALTATSAHAAVVFTGAGSATEVNDTELAYAGDVSNSDLLHGLAVTAVGFNGGGDDNALNDGVLGNSFSNGGGVNGAWTADGATATYDLGLGTNGLGWDITSIQSFAAWVNVDFGDQAWTVAVSTDDVSYDDVATVDYGPTSNGGSTKVTLTDLDISGIQYIKFTANLITDNGNGQVFIWREIDVEGTATAVPEPSSAALLGLGGLALLRRRRRN